jgi:hypothetical protein
MLAPLPGADEDGDEDEDSDSRAGGFVREGPIVSLHADASTDVAPTSASLKNPSAGSGGDEDEDGDEDTDAGSR